MITSAVKNRGRDGSKLEIATLAHLVGTVVPGRGNAPMFSLLKRQKAGGFPPA
jgi:hypothetical protein